MPLKSVERIQQRLNERPAELAAERKRGKKVAGWQGYNMPEEIIFALGFIPIRIAFGGDDRLVEVGSRYISTKNCVFVRETMGLFAENKDPYIKNIDILAFDVTCLQTYRTAELLQYFFNKEVLILGVPRNFYWEEALVYFGKELEYFTSRLEEYAGVKLTNEALAAAIGLYHETRTTLAAIYEYQAAANPAVTWFEAYEIIQAGYYLDRTEYLALLKDVLAELQSLAPEPVIAESSGEARIFLSGSVIPPGDRKLITIIESFGGRIVGDDIWTGIVPNLNVNITGPAVSALARAYLNRTPHGALPYLDLQSDRRIAHLKSQIKKYKAYGVIYHTLRYCDPYTFKAKETKDVLAEYGVPFLEIHTEYAGSDYEAIRTRVEAFVEMLKAKK
jgi:benzoyl-CoA reductase/2-hydroxyglutaryl-CoA dehydratase subunit BcrC/BadD/HgdB